MPQLKIKKPGEVPPPSRVSAAAREQQRIYDEFVRQVSAGGAGELELLPKETVRGVKTRLRRASGRVGVPLQIWDVDGKVYFTRAIKRGRRRRQAAAVT